MRDLSPTAWEAVFAGEKRSFDLTVGAVAVLETQMRMGLGEICTSFVTHRWHRRAIGLVIQHGLVGGGLDEAEAIALVDATIGTDPTRPGQPLDPFVDLAANILGAQLQGREAVMAATGQGDASKKAEAGPDNPDPAT